MTPHILGRAKPALRSRTFLAAVAVLVVLAGYLVATTLDAHAAATLLSQGKPATASCDENAGTPASAAFDGNTGTRWSCCFSDPQWIEVDLGGTATISQVVLNWEAAYGKAFQLQTSTDNATWTSIYSTTTGTGGTQTLNVTGTGRYVRLYGTARATQYGYSLWEFQVFGSTGTGGGSCGTVDAAQGKTTTASSAENAGTPATSATDGNTGTRWSSAFSDPQWLQVDLGVTAPSAAVLTWEAAYATAFQIQISSNGTTWTTIYSTTTGTGGTQNLTGLSGTGRYVRVYGTARATQYGYSLWELAVLTVGNAGSPSATPTQSANGNCPWVGSTAPVATRVSQLLGADDAGRRRSRCCTATAPATAVHREHVGHPVAVHPGHRLPRRAGGRRRRARRRHPDAVRGHLGGHLRHRAGAAVRRGRRAGVRRQGRRTWRSARR